MNKLSSAEGSLVSLASSSHAADGVSQDLEETRLLLLTIVLVRHGCLLSLCSAADGEERHSQADSCTHRFDGTDAARLSVIVDGDSFHLGWRRWAAVLVVGTSFPQVVALSGDCRERDDGQQQEERERESHRERRLTREEAKKKQSHAQVLECKEDGVW